MKEREVKIIFVSAKSRFQSENMALQMENDRYNDIIIGDFIDSYRNLTIKSLFMLKWFVSYYKNTEYLLKIDDNVRVDIAVLLNILRHYNDNHGTSSNAVIGHVLKNRRPERKRHHKWYIPHTVYSESKYPDYIAGPSYLMRSDVAEAIYKACSGVSVPLPMEDVFITGICRKKANINTQYSSRFCYTGVHRASTGKICATEHHLLARRGPWLISKQLNMTKYL